MPLIVNLLKFFKNYLFVNFWLHWDLVVACSFLWLRWLETTLYLWCVDLLQWPLIASMGSRVYRLQLWCTGLVASPHVKSSLTMPRTCAPCFGRQILKRWTTRKI